MKTKLILWIIPIILSLQTGCLYAVRYDGSYRGKVVEQETREPIEGVVVLGQWSIYHFSPGGGSTTFFDAREAVTDMNGEFIIPGQGLRIMTSVGPMGVLVYKAGYTYYQTGSWDTIKTGLYSGKEVKWEGDMPVFPLRKLTEDERKKYSMPMITSDAIDKAKLMTREINAERLHIGLQPIF